MIADTIGKQINEAMKSHDEVRLTTLRMLSAALHNAEIEKIGKLTKDEEFIVVKREVKKRRDAIEIYEKAQDQNKAGPKTEKEKQELNILMKFLPEQMGEEDLIRLIDQIISETGATGIQDMGKVIGGVMQKAKDQADGTLVAKLVKERFGTRL